MHVISLFCINVQVFKVTVPYVVKVGVLIVLTESQSESQMILLSVQGAEHGAGTEGKRERKGLSLSASHCSTKYFGYRQWYEREIVFYVGYLNSNRLLFIVTTTKS